MMRATNIATRMVLALVAGLALTFGSVPALAEGAPDPAGTWHGAVTLPTGDLTLIVYVTKGEDGTLSGELESIDQAPGTRIPVAELAAKDGRLSFKIPSLGASYEGEWTEAEHRWKGTFHQSAELPLALEAGMPPPEPVIEGMDGRWETVLTRNDAKLRLVLRVATTPELGTRVNFDSPDQLAFGLPVKDLKREGQKVSFSLAIVGAAFHGTLSEDHSQMTGSWTNPAAEPVELTFTRASQIAQRKPIARPQEPKPPFPYQVEEVAFDNARQDVHLAGTLTLPEGKGPFPAAVMITGSGAQDRDEAIMGHKPFAVIADYLTRHGIAVLRFDDRGVGKSTGDYSSATSADLATDANAAFAFLRTRAEIDPGRIGFIGHSEGGMIGPIAMADNPYAAFLVMLAGPGTDLDKLLLSQRRLMLTTMGASQDEIDRQEPVMAALFRAIGTAKTPEAGMKAARKVLTPEAMVALGAKADTPPEAVLSQLGGPWFHYFFNYDPREFLHRIAVPVLAMNGSLDLQVPASENLPAVKAALDSSPDVTIMELDGLNHLFQHATTGGIGEYGSLEETFAPEALEAMAGWINARYGNR